MIDFVAEDRDRGKRLDSLIHQVHPEWSRSRIQEWIRAGEVLVEGSAQKPSYVIRGGERVTGQAAALPPLHAAMPEELPLRVLYEDEWMLAIDKPAGMTVHAGAGVQSGTLVNALLHRFQKLSTLGGELRPGIVHRLDRWTSGLILVAKTDIAHAALAQLFSKRMVHKTYLALVHRAMETETGRVDRPIARDPVHRTRMTARLNAGRAAWTEWRILERFPDFSYLQVVIGTGRTHQIRVHLSSIRHPVVGDQLYGAPAHVAGMPDLGRYFLHAHRLELAHPITKVPMQFISSLPEPLEDWLTKLRQYGSEKRR